MSARERGAEKTENEGGQPGYLLERRLTASKTGSRTSILSRRSSGRVTPEDQQSCCLDLDQLSEDSARLSGLEVNPLYEGKRRKSSLSSKPLRTLGSSNTSLESARSPTVSGRRARNIRNFVACPPSGLSA